MSAYTSTHGSALPAPDALKTESCAHSFRALLTRSALPPPGGAQFWLGVFSLLCVSSYHGTVPGHTHPLYRCGTEGVPPGRAADRTATHAPRSLGTRARVPPRTPELGVGASSTEPSTVLYDM